jgi:hypothetical protein
MTPLERVLALMLLVSAAAVLYWRTWRILREAEQREAARVAHETTRMYETYFRRMDTACTDGETCDLCGAVSKVREMVDLADDVVLLCLGCAPMLRRKAREVTHD